MSLLTYLFLKDISLRETCRKHVKTKKEKKSFCGKSICGQNGVFLRAFNDRLLTGLIRFDLICSHLNLEQGWGVGGGVKCHSANNES